MKQLFFRVTALIISIVLSLVFAEALFRILQIGYGNAPLESDPILDHRHPRNYVYLVHTPNKEYGGHYVQYDSEGNRVTTHPSEKPLNPKYRIAVMGDSFVEATQVAYEKSFVGLMDKFGIAHGCQIKNYGVSSYSPIPYWLQWKNTVKSFKPTHIFVLLYSNDIDDDRGYASHAIVAQNGDILAIPGPGNNKWEQLLRKLYLVRFIRKVQLQMAWVIKHKSDQQVAGNIGGFIETSPEMTPLTEKMMLNLSREVTDSGARFILSAVPSKYRLIIHHKKSLKPEFSDMVKQWAEKNQIEFLDLIPAFQKASIHNKLFFEQDIHLNEMGHQVVFNVIKNAFPELFSDS
jgi:hypothetical protein